MKKVLILLLFLAPFSSGAYYNPGSPSGFVNDYAGILKTEEGRQIEADLENFQNETSNEIAVVTISSLRGDTIENFAVKLFEDWKIGKTNKDNGVLFLISKEDKKLRIEVGYGLEGALTDAQSSTILNDFVKPAFKNGDYYSGIKDGVSQIESAIKGEFPASAQTNTNNGADNSFILWLIFVVFMISLRTLPQSKSWWGGGIAGGIIGILTGALFGFLYIGVAAIILFSALGLIFDFFSSRAYQKNKLAGRLPFWMMWINRGGRGGGPGGGGFGGFGGGSSGGGGASGDW